MCGRCVASDYHARVSHQDGGYHVVVSQDDFCNIGIYIKMVTTMVGLSLQQDGGYHVGVSHQDDFFNIGLYNKMMATMVGLSITWDWCLPSYLDVSAGGMESLFWTSHLI